jgi:AraC family transcriptional regulator
MPTIADAQKFHVKGGDRLAFMNHIHWSARPDVTMFDNGDLPIAAMRFHRCDTVGPVEVIGKAPSQIDWDVLFVNRSGTGTLAIDCCGERRETAIHRDLCCLFPAGIDNTLRFDSNAGAFALYIQPGLLSALPETAGQAAFEPILGRRIPRLAHLIGLIEAELMRPGLGTELMIEGLLRALAGMVAGRDEARHEAECARIYLAPARLKRVIEFIEAHLDQHIGLDDLAATAGLSANHFLRVFKLSTGETPYHFLRARRIERARTLLAHGDLPLAQLALECGFANQAHFTAAFSRELGISPGRYRRSTRDKVSVA